MKDGHSIGGGMLELSEGGRLWGLRGLKGCDTCWKKGFGDCKGTEVRKKRIGE